MRVKFVRGFVMKPFASSFFKRPVHPFYLAVGPGVEGLRKALLNAPLVAELADRVTARLRLVRQVAKLATVVRPYFRLVARRDTI